METNGIVRMGLSGVGGAFFKQAKASDSMKRKKLAKDSDFKLDDGRGEKRNGG